MGPAGAAELADFLAGLPAREPLLWCGLGSNLLVRDGGFPGTVLLTQGGLDGLAVADGRVRAEAGVACGRLARETVRAGLGGLAFLAGIPGTVGGALALNAGAWGGTTWERLVAVETVDRTGRIRHRTPADFEVGYRWVHGPSGESFLAATWALEPAPVAELREAGAGLALYPLSAFRAMSQAAEAVYTAIREEGTQRGVLDRMQTREALYEVLGYHAYERKLDELFGRD